MHNLKRNKWLQKKTKPLEIRYDRRCNEYTQCVFTQKDAFAFKSEKRNSNELAI